MMKKVIIIDDSVTALNLLRNKFESIGWEVYDTSSAKEGYNLIFNIAPDIIITDALMPIIGGFQFIKMTHENPLTSKIPIIVYSVLPESNAKFYIKEARREYFLPKSESMDEVISLADKLTKRYPLDEANKAEILQLQQTASNISDETSFLQMPQETRELSAEEIQKKFKYNPNFDDEKVFSDFFCALYPFLNYELCVVCPCNSSKKEKCAFFDIRDIILSPIFQEKIVKKYGAKETVLYKKYAPNLKTISNENEFLSKVEFNFEYREKPLADIVFYSKEQSKWDNTENMEAIKNAVESFFVSYFVNKNNTSDKKSNIGRRYTNGKFNFSKERITVVGIINIVNYMDAAPLLSKEDNDVISSKISEKIIACLEEDEQVIKNDEDEYFVIMQVDEYNNIKDRFAFIVNTLEQIKYNDFSVEAVVGVSECNTDIDYNIYEAQKNAYEALEKTSAAEKVVIYGT